MRILQAYLLNKQFIWLEQQRLYDLIKSARGNTNIENIHHWMAKSGQFDYDFLTTIMTPIFLSAYTMSSKMLRRFIQENMESIEHITFYLSRQPNLTEEIINEFNLNWRYDQILEHCPLVSFRFLYPKLEQRSTDIQQDMYMYYIISKLTFEHADLIDVDVIVRNANITWSDMEERLSTLTTEQIKEFARHNPNMTLKLFHENRHLPWTLDDVKRNNYLKFSEILEYANYYPELLKSNNNYIYQSFEEYITHMNSIDSASVPINCCPIITMQQYENYQGKLKKHLCYNLPVDELINLGKNVMIHFDMHPSRKLLGLRKRRLFLEKLVQKYVVRKLDQLRLAPKSDTYEKAFASVKV